MNEYTICGRNAVIELIKSGRDIDKLYIAQDLGGRMTDIISLAKAGGIIISYCDRRKLDSIATAHQGIVAMAAAKDYVEIDDILNVAKERGENPLIVICDGITDPHNLGAIIRSAETAGAHGVIIPKRRSAGLNDISSKSSAGALEHIAICKVGNIINAIRELKDKGVWIFGADSSGDTDMLAADFKGSSAIIIGSEGSGINELTRRNCDFLVSVKLKGKINSLNASTAAAVLLFTAAYQRP